jgi:hypothetical protein
MSAPAPTQPTGTTPAAAPSGLQKGDLSHVVFWSLGVLVLLLLADYTPRLALLLTGLLATGTVLRFSGNITSLLKSSAPGGTNTALAPTALSASNNGTSKGANTTGTGGLLRMRVLA